MAGRFGLRPISHFVRALLVPITLAVVNGPAACTHAPTAGGASQPADTKHLPSSATAPATLPAGTSPAAIAAAGDQTPPGKPRFADRGAQVGDEVPDLPLYELEGEGTSLRRALSRRCTLLLTSSYTCPKSRSTYPRAEELADAVKGKVKVVIIYVVEAHPKGDPSPYLGVEDVTPENLRDGVLCRQPRTLEERLKLAKEFKERLRVNVPTYVDAMDNAVWEALGGGPNMGILVNAQGIVAARQGWFDSASMRAAAEALARAAGAEEVKDSERPDWKTAQPVLDGDLAAVRQMVDARPELVRYVEPWFPRGNSGGMTLLQHAAESNRPEIADFLVSRGAILNYQNVHAPSALDIAARRGNVAVVEVLLKAGADANLRSPLGPTPLQAAVIAGHPDVAELLRKAGAKPNFFTAACTGDVAAVRDAIDADPTRANRPDGLGRTALAYAAAGGQPAVVELLVSRGAKDPPEAAGEPSSLWWAIEHRHLDIARLLLDRGANPNTREEARDQTLLAAAARRGDTDVMRLLLAYGADPKYEDMHGYQAIHAAAAENRPEAIRLLYEAGADLNAPVGFDRSPCGPSATFGAPLVRPLDIATSAGSFEAIRTLIASGADVNALNGTAQTRPAGTPPPQGPPRGLLGPP